MTSYLPSVIKKFKYYKTLGDKTISVLSFEELQNGFSEHSNSISIIVKHLVGNMLSRWTNFLDEDGEKPWRHRDEEFINSFTSKDELISTWNKGWDCVFDTLESLSTDHLETIVYIRNHGHTVTEAINRQLMHYAYHVGQIVFLGKLIKNDDWESLSIPKGVSKTYNTDKFQKDKARRHFTEDL